MHHRLARQVLRQAAPGRLALLVRRCRRSGFSGGFAGISGLARFGSHSRRRRGFARLDLLDRQLKLSDLARQFLRRLAELHAAQLGQLHPQLLDFERLELQRLIGEVALDAALAGNRPQADHQLPQAVSIFRESGSFIKHVNLLP
jgi:hypothetical protein